MPSTTRTRTILLLAVCLSVTLAGCGNGWGEDGPADQGDGQDQEPNQSDDLEEADNASQDAENESDAPSDTETTTTADDGDSGDSANREESNTSSNTDTSSDETTAGSDESSDESQQQNGEDTTSPDEGSDASDGEDTQEDSQAPSEGSDDSSDEESPQNEQDGEEQEQEQEDDRPVYDLTVYAGEIYPVEGAEITIERHSDGATTTRTTGEDGSVTFPVYEGDYTVVGVDPQGNTEEQQVTVESDTEILMPTLMDEVPPTHSLTVTVIDANTGEPVEGATVSGVGGVLPSGADALVSGETDENGKVTVEVFEGHTYLIDIQAEGYERESREVTISGDETETFGIGPEKPDPEPNETNPDPVGNETDPNATSSLRNSAAAIGT